MKVSKISKIVSVLFIIAAVALALNISLASVIDIPSPSTVSAAGFGKSISNVLYVVSLICYAAAVILLIVLGVKWLVAAPDAKADLKKTAIYYVVGAVMVFAAGAILNVIKNVATSTITTT